MSRNLICIACPVGCHLTAEEKNGEIAVSGNKCPRGRVYAVNELTNPKRMVTSVVRSSSELVPFVPVRTSTALEMRLIPGLLEALRLIKIDCPVVSGMVVLADFEGSGVDVIATRSVEK